MKQADEIWMWFALGTILGILASVEFAIAIGSVIAKDSGGVLISGASGGIWAGLLLALAIKLWLNTKTSVLETKHE